MLEPIDAFRAKAKTMDLATFCKSLGGPVLLRRETIDGDVSFADREGSIAPPRPGATLRFEPDLARLQERLERPTQPGHTAVPEEVFALAGGARSSIAVGRAPDNDLVLNDPSVSQHHARLNHVVGTDWVFATDLGSRNGTGHNDRLVANSERIELAAGDEICFGSQLFIFLRARDLYLYLAGKR